MFLSCWAVVLLAVKLPLIDQLSDLKVEWLSSKKSPSDGKLFGSITSENRRNPNLLSTTTKNTNHILLVLYYPLHICPNIKIRTGKPIILLRLLSNNMFHYGTMVQCVFTSQLRDNANWRFSFFSVDSVRQLFNRDTTTIFNRYYDGHTPAGPWPGFRGLRGQNRFLWGKDFCFNYKFKTYCNMTNAVVKVMQYNLFFNNEVSFFMQRAVVQ